MVRQDAAAIMEEWQRRHEKYLQLSNEFVRATERQIMCLDRAIAAHRRERNQDVVSLCVQVFEALWYGGAWPGADGRMWDREAKRAELSAQSIEKELHALGDPSFLDLLDDPATLEACYGPLVEYDCPLGSEIYLPSDSDEGMEKATLRWVFKDENGEILLLTSKSHPVDEDLEERENEGERMDEQIKDWLLPLRWNWQHLQEMVKEVRGVVRDRKGKHYWLYIREYRTGSFRISLCPWPGLTFSTSTCAGWISVGITQSKTSWEIHDLQVKRPRYKQRGLGTALVHEAIALARRRGAHDLRGSVTTTDAREYPFLPAWYARLGFAVQFYDVSNYGIWGGVLATFRMDLSPAASSSAHSKPAGRKLT